MNDSIKYKIKEDIKKLKAKFGNKLISASLFGSSTFKDIESVNDIDIVLFVDGISLNNVRDIILNLSLSFPAFNLCEYFYVDNSNDFILTILSPWTSPGLVDTV